MIGQAGNANHNLTVRKNGTARTFTIVNERQETDGTWSYQLDDRLAPRFWVTGADAGYDLVQPPPLTQAQQAVATFVDAHLQAGPAGTVTAWVPPGDDPNTYAFGAAMGIFEVSKGPAYILWSGGASDCLIVAALSGQKGYLTHRDRQEPKIASIVATISVLGPNPTVWLASERFAAGGAQAARSTMVVETITALQNAGYNIASIHPTRQFALNTRTGAVLAQFDPNNPKLKLL